MRKQLTNSSNQKGVTLIELLVTLTVFSIVIGVVYSALFNTINYNNKTFSKVTIQQEANIFLSQFSNVHLYNKKYNVVYDAVNNVYKIILLDGSGEEFPLTNPIHQYEVYINSTLVGTAPITVDQKEVKIKLKITDPANKNEFSIQTTLDKL